LAEFKLILRAYDQHADFMILVRADFADIEARSI
jgi:hypothetical protein